VQAMELKKYSKTLSKIRGECWAPEATRYLYALAFHKKVRLTSQLNQTRPNRKGGSREFRTVEVWRDGRWQDVQGLLLDAGLVLAEASQKEYRHNREYSTRAQQAALAGRGIWGNPTHCGAGPAQAQPLTVTVNYDAAGGEDLKNINGEWIAIHNGGTEAVSLNGWWVRDSSNRGYQAHGYQFPAGSSVAAGSTLRLHVGRGDDNAENLHWGLTYPAFVNPTTTPKWMGDGGFLFDRDGDLRAWDMYPCRVAC
jgi:micrococcal nuclease